MHRGGVLFYRFKDGWVGACDSDPPPPMSPTVSPPVAHGLVDLAMVVATCGGQNLRNSAFCAALFLAEIGGGYPDT